MPTASTTPTLTTLVGFNGSDGDGPTGGLVADGNGDLFGTTASGGADNDGTMFELVRSGGGYAAVPNVLVSFNGGSNGGLPYGGLLMDPTGDLFGTTASGGAANNAGTVFEFTRGFGGSGGLSTADFDGTDGAAPEGSLLLDASGDLLGTAATGGTGYNGVVFEFARTATGYSTAPTVVVAFNGSDGSHPVGGLITVGAVGNLYGTTSGGGAYGDGTVFAVLQTGVAGSYASQPLVLASFNGNDGSSPAGSLIADANGDLFGTTSTGGQDGKGTVFELVRTAMGYASTPTVLASFTGGNGANPQDSLVADANGDLFGTTEKGGADNDGTVFEIAHTAGGYAPLTTVVTFTGSNGANPVGNLIADAKGDLFGTTENGGAGSEGTVFEVTNAAFEVACFCRGTRIATPRGEVAVERLQVGDLVLTRSGTARPLTWIGRGRSLVTPANPSARPIIVRAGALADGVPARDLYLTRGHSLLLDGVLIPVEYLVNDRSVLWDAQARVVEFFHLELEHHDILLADGAEAESYREDGNRHLFHNTDAPRHATHGMAPYAPVRTGGPEVDQVWARLLARATPDEVVLTEDADLHLLADGVRVVGAPEDPMRHCFRLERVPFELRIGSRVCNPVRMGTGRDPRDLGVALRRLVLRGEGAELVLGWDSPWLQDGFNGPEPEARSRWTTGDALVPVRALAAFEGALEVEIEFGMLTRYPRPADEQDVTMAVMGVPERTGTLG